MNALARFSRHATQSSLTLAHRQWRKLAVRGQICLSTVNAGQISPRYNSTAAEVPPPPADLAAKVYPPKIEQLVSDISQLTLVEVADLNELLKKTLNIQDAPMMAVGGPMQMAAPKAPEEEEEAAPKREKTNFTVKLVSFDAGKKVQLIKEIKNCVEGLNLVQAKKFVESAPQIVRADVSKEEAEKLKEALAAVGAEIAVD